MVQRSKPPANKSRLGRKDRVHIHTSRILFECRGAALNRQSQFRTSGHARRQAAHNRVGRPDNRPTSARKVSSRSLRLPAISRIPINNRDISRPALRASGSITGIRPTYQQLSTRSTVISVRTLALCSDVQTAIDILVIASTAAKKGSFRRRRPSGEYLDHLVGRELLARPRRIRRVLLPETPGRGRQARAVLLRARSRCPDGRHVQAQVLAQQSGRHDDDREPSILRAHLSCLLQRAVHCVFR